MAELVLEEVSRVFAGVRAVDRLSLAVGDREFLVLVGKSGCGKTTTLRLVAGLDCPSSGQIRIGGRSLRGVPARQRDVAMVFQHPGLYPHWTVYRNIAFGLELRERGGFWRRLAGPNLARSLPSVAERVTEVAGWLGIERLLERRPSELSGGERQRVALGRAIVRRPAVFLLDEPLAGLDAGLRVEMRRLLARLHQRLPTTTLYVTHDQAEALTLGQRIAVMNAGRVEQVGSPSDVYERPANRFVAEFIGSPPMNFLPGRLEQSSGAWQWVGLGWSVAVPADVAQRVAALAAGPVECGIRPEDIELAERGTAGARPSVRLPAVVRRSELLGSEVLVEMEVGADAEHRLRVCCVLPRADGKALLADARLTIGLDFSRAHWFDAATGNNLLATAD